MPSLTSSICRNEPLSKYSTFKIGGPAKYFFKATCEEELREAIGFARQENCGWICIGRGSNSLFDDQGFDGLVILNKIDGIKERGSGRFWAGAGHSFAHLGVWTARRGWTGLEFASGIPASVGGAVVMNAGANGRECSESLLEVRYLHGDGRIEVFERSNLQFSYRSSPFQDWKGVVLGAEFQLQRDEQARARQLEIVNYRQRTQPYGQPSAGCVFRNPGSEGAGALIDRLGLKGMRVGDAEVSTLHANFVVNRGAARAEDVLALLEQIEQRAAAEGVSLQREVRVIPYHLDS